MSGDSKDVLLWKPGVVIFALWAAVIVGIVRMFLFPPVFPPVPTWIPLEAAVIGAALLFLAAFFAHEGAHRVSGPLLGLRTRGAGWRWGFIPCSVAVSGVASWPAYAITLAAPMVLGVLLLLPAGMVQLGLLPADLRAAALALAWLGTVILAGAPDDAARIAALLRMRPPRVEESPDGRRFRPAGGTQWISVNPLVDGSPAERRAAIGGGLLVAVLASLLLFP